MKRVILFISLFIIGLNTYAQQNIQLRSADRAECVKSDMTSLKASFSFSTIEAEDYSSVRGTFSWLSLPNTVLSGNVGEPQIPVVNELIAVPFGAQPRIEITSYSSTDYNLAEYGMKTLVPRQRPVRKSDNPEEVPFIINEAAYQTHGLRSEPKATINVEGTMRGIQIGSMTIEPVSYDPVNNTIRVFNDIEVTVHFDGADAQATEDMLLKTYSPAFDAVYAQLFNGKAITDVYTDHPDLYNTPVKMLVICYSGFQGNAALNSWLQWKLQKGYYVDIYYTNETGTTASNIKNFIKTKYNASVSAGNAYTYLIVIGDTDQVPYYMVKYIDDDIEYCASDLGYAAVNFTTSSTSNYFPDMYYSRISVENTTHLTNYMNKVLTYEKYEFADGGNYLNNVILVGGWDSNWTARVAKPTINYATNNYFNSSNTTYGGFNGGTISATVSTSSTQGWSGTNHGCYNGLNDGVCFLNYTAHGDKQEWYQPKISANQIESFTNTGKYFFGVGNCCLTGNFNLDDANYSSSYNPSSAIGATACFAETMIRVPNAGAVAYVGCSPYSYWYEDFYWAVGAHSYSAGNAPSVSGSSTGVYDIMFNDQYWNSASALMYLGNLAVQQAVTNGNTNSGISGSGEGGDCLNSAHYYFQFYHTFGDGSIMPYITKPEQNTVTIPSTVTPGTSSITVNALAGSYVAVTDNSSVIYGVAEANSSGVAIVNFTNAIPSSGTLHVVVTRQQYQPYFGSIQIVGGTQYNITVNQPQHGVISAPAQAYANTIVTLEATPETGYCLSNWNVKDADNNSITVTNNQFTMPESNVTVTATFVQGMAVTLASVTHGSISADPMYALQGMTIHLTATPDQGYELGSWLVYKTDDMNTAVTVTGDSFTMPDYPVTVSANFVLGPTDLTVYDGTATNQYIPMYGYYFDDYTKSECIIPATQLTSMVGGTISAITFYPSSVESRSWGESQQTVFLKEVSSTTLSGSYSGMSGATTVKVSSPLEMPVAGSPYTITFDTPYTYNGGNLLIGIYNTDDGDYNKVEWYGTNNLTSGVSAYGFNGSNLNNVSYTAQSFLPKTTFTYIPTSLNSYTITATAEPSEGGTVTVGSSKGNRADLVYDFEDGTYQGWTTFQGNTTSPHSWMHITEYSYAYNYSSMSSGHGYNSSDGYMYSESYITGSSGGNGTIVTPDNYLVSPQVRLGGSITFHAGAQNVSYCAEHFSLMVSTTGNNAANNFTAVQTWTFTPTVSSGSEWQEFTVDLSAYNGMGYIAIRHFDCSDEWFLCIDDITIVEGPDSSTASGNFLSGETCVVTATPVGDYHFVNWTENDILVSTDASYSFTVDSDRNLVANFSTFTPFTMGILGYDNGGGWYLIASPLADAVTPTATNGFLTNEYDLYAFDQSEVLEWRNYEATPFNLESGKGYLYASQQKTTLVFTGMPYSGDGIVTLSKSESVTWSGWNLIGNPWSVNATIGNKDFYRMNTDHDEIIISEDSEIAPMEGIFVHTYEDEETVTFSTSGAKANFANERIILNLSYDDATVIDRAIVRFGEGSTLPKFQIKDNSTKLYFTQDGRDYAVIRTDGQGEIPVHFKASENGEYTLTISASLTSQLSTLTLIDNLTGDNIDILQTPSYSFNARTTDYTSRFRLVFSSDNDDCTPFAFISNDQLFVTGDGTLQIFDALGRQCYGKELSTSNSQLPTSNFHPGVYVLRLVNGESVKIQKIIIK